MRYRRCIVNGATYFFTVAIHDRDSRLLTDNIAILRRAFKKVKEQYPFHLDAIVVLPDHFHMLMTLPENDTEYSKRIRLIKTYFSKEIKFNETLSVSRIQKSERGLWQRRFWEHTIRNEKDYLYHVRYIHYNPVKHGYVEKATEWQYSTVHQYIKEGILSAGWNGSV